MTSTETYAQPIVRSASVLTGEHTSANGGLSSRYRNVEVYPQGTFESEIDPARVANAVTLERGNLSGTVVAVPVVQPTNSAGPMASGAYIATSDSRFRKAVEGMLGHRFYGAIPLHDRFETWEQYNHLSI